MQGVTSCDYLGIDLVQQDDAARQIFQPILSSVNPDLRAFKAHGGKMIQYAGWADTAIAPENGLNYYRKVTDTIGDPHDFYRVFMAPGMAHCSGGAGPNAFGNGTSNGPVIDADHDLVKVPGALGGARNRSGPDHRHPLREQRSGPGRGSSRGRSARTPNVPSMWEQAIRTTPRTSNASRITIPSIRATSDLSALTKREDRASYRGRLQGAPPSCCLLSPPAAYDLSQCRRIPWKWALRRPPLNAR